jgi:hypothetical protein
MGWRHHRLNLSIRAFDEQRLYNCCMAMFQDSELAFVRTVADLAYCNPFEPRRIELERLALGDDFQPRSPAWNVRPDEEDEDANVSLLYQRISELTQRIGRRIAEGASPAPAERGLLGDLVLFQMYHDVRDDLDRAITHSSSNMRFGFYDRFAEMAQRYHFAAGELPHLFACIFQVRRAFYNIFQFIVGRSRPAAQLRAAVWQSIFTHDMRRYRRVLYPMMADYTTLITGPSGTGKELVARAVGLSRYIPFDPKTRTFAEDFAGSFHALNLSALSPTLIESELFGHKRGSFTGAVADRAGWMEQCSTSGTVFLDEIGELDPAVQVKLLRVLQTRTFNRLGETKSRSFQGKIIAATNRDVAQLMRSGQMRTDFYYRVCSDVIDTPSLRQRIDDEPGELHELVHYIAARIAGGEADSVAEEVEAWIAKHLGRDYPWPGNVRELEQCVRNVLIRQSYDPPGADKSLLDTIAEGRMSAEQVLRRYCRIVYARCGSYEQAARVLGLDRRTVKAKVTAPLSSDAPASSAESPTTSKVV